MSALVIALQHIQVFLINNDYAAIAVVGPERSRLNFNAQFERH